MIVTLAGFVGCNFLGLEESDETTPSGANVFQMVTGQDTEDDRQHWNTLFNTRAYVFGKEPSVFLRDYVHQLPIGRALDIAMGEGQNAVYLAKKGFTVDGVDFSEVAIRKARRLARENRVQINTINADLNHYQIRPDSYDVILNIDYLQRNLVSQIKRGLKKGGVVLFQSYTVEQLKNAGGKELRRDYLLEKGELQELFKDLKIIYFVETNDGKDAWAKLVAKK